MDTYHTLGTLSWQPHKTPDSLKHQTTSSHRPSTNNGRSIPVSERALLLPHSQGAAASSAAISVPLLWAGCSIEHAEPLALQQCDGHADG